MNLPQRGSKLKRAPQATRLVGPGGMFWVGAADADASAMHQQLDLKILVA